MDKPEVTAPCPEYARRAQLTAPAEASAEQLPRSGQAPAEPPAGPSPDAVIECLCLMADTALEFAVGLEFLAVDVEHHAPPPAELLSRVSDAAAAAEEQARSLRTLQSLLPGQVSE